MGIFYTTLLISFFVFFLKFSIVKRINGDKQNRNQFNSILIDGKTWKKLLQNRLTCYVCHCALGSASTSDVSDHTSHDVTSVEGRAAGRCDNSFSYLLFAST